MMPKPAREGGMRGTGLFSLSADPIHWGHLNVIRRAAKACENLIVLITDSEGKDYLFNLATRLQIAKRAVEHHIKETNIRVIGSSDLLVDVFLREGCDVMFRGVRDGEDRRFEEAQMKYHSRILPDFHLSVRYLDAQRDFRDLSSTLVRSFVSKGLDVSDMVPLFVKSKMERRVLDRYVIGITGQMGAGKTYVAEKVVARFQEKWNVPAMHLNVDALVRDLYVEQSPGADRVRQGLVQLLGESILTEDGTQVNGDMLKKLLATGKIMPETRRDMHELTAPHVYRLMRERQQGFHGVVLLEWAQLIESGMCALVNNDVIIVDASPNHRNQFLRKRGVDPALAARFGTEQWDTTRKMSEHNESIMVDGCGVCIRYENAPGRDPAENKPMEIPVAIMKLFPDLEFVR